MSAKTDAFLRAVITLVFYMVGLGLVWRFSNWKVALGMFLFVYANNRSFGDILRGRMGRRVTRSALE